MAKTFNPQRVGGGTFSLVRDSQGNYSVKETGFDKVVSLPMIELGQTAQTTTAKQTKTASQLTGQTAQVLTSGATTGGGGGGGAFQFTNISPYKLQQQGEDVSKRLTDIDSGRGGDSASALARQTANMGVSVDSGRGGTSASALARQRANEDTGALDLAEMDTTKTLGIKDTSEVLDEPFKGTGTMTTAQRSKLTGGTRVGPGTIKSRMAADDISSNQAAKTATQGMGVDPTKMIPQMGSLGISASPQTTQVADQDLEADAGTQAQLGIKKAPTAVDQLKATGTQIKKTADSILQPGASVKIIGQVIGGVLKAISPEPSVMDKFKTGYFKTNFDLGSSTDPGRIVGNPQTNVFAGMNRNSAFGNLGQSGQKRVDRVSGYAAKNRDKAEKARKAGNLEKARKYDEKAKRQEDKARTFQEQVDKYNKDKPVTGTTAPGQKGGADNTRDSGKIVCTMMNESYGFGSFRNKIWMKFHRNISPEYQKGYHKLFLPLVKYAKQKGITNKFIKNILEHIAVHSTIDMRQSLRGKRHTLGRVYRRIILPLCYWAGSK